jgi:hypothetical protein
VEGENSTSGPQPYQPYEGGDYHLPYFQQKVCLKIFADLYLFLVHSSFFSNAFLAFTVIVCSKTSPPFRLLAAMICCVGVCCGPLNAVISCSPVSLLTSSFSIMSSILILRPLAFLVSAFEAELAEVSLLLLSLKISGLVPFDRVVLQLAV